MHKITIPDRNISFNASSVRTLLVNLLINEVSIQHKCGGKAQCGTCRVIILDGEENVTQPTEAELAKLANFNAPSGMRLACQIYVRGPISLQIPLNY